MIDLDPFCFCHQCSDEMNDFEKLVPSQRENKENFQNHSYHLIVDERNKMDLKLSLAKETISFYFQTAILAVDSLWSTYILWHQILGLGNIATSLFTSDFQSFSNCAGIV